MALREVSKAENAWRVDARTKQGGSRRFFRTRNEADTFASQCRITRGKGIAAFGNEELAKYGKNVQWAIDFALAHLRAMEKSVSVADAITELLAARKAAGRNEEYRWGLNHRLTKFQEAFPDLTIATITGKQIDNWLAGLACAPATRNTFRRDIITLMSFCERRGYCEKNEAMKTEMATNIDKPPGILTPGEALGILCTCEVDLIPYTSISLFAGLRAAEVEKLDWGEVDLDSLHIEVKAAKAKTQRRRLVPIADNLQAWLKDHVKKSGAIAPANLRRKLEASRRAVGFGTAGTENEAEKKAGIRLREWPSNAMRHSFASYQLAQCQDAAKVALEMGNSPAIVFAHYRELVKPKDATLFWEIKPSTEAGKKVVAFAAP